MLTAYRADTIRAAEAALPRLLADGTLMQRAAVGVAAACLGELRSRAGGSYARRVLVVVGPGNNGGDGLYAAARLCERGVVVGAWRTAATVHEGGWAAFLGAGGRVVDAVAAVEWLADCDLVIDAVLGLGGRPGLRSEVAALAAACLDLGVPVVAVDLPSGLDADSGTVGESFTAALTVTFGGRRLCHLLEPARSRCGAIQVVDIGLALADADLDAWTLADLAGVWPIPGPKSDKYSRGVVGFETGSASYPGAAVLGVGAAVHSGAGMVRYRGPKAVGREVVRAYPNVVLGDGRVQARVLGSGWGERPDGDAVVAAALAEGSPLVLDADALRHLPRGPLGAHVLLTPHAGELAVMLGVARPDVTNDPLAAVAAAVARTGATVLLKGATQVVRGPGDVHATLAIEGPGWTAQAGSGDCLAGAAGMLLAAGLSARTAALAAASLQAVAARRHLGPQPPQALAAHFAEVVGSLASLHDQTTFV